MNKSFVSKKELFESSLLEKMRKRKKSVCFNLEVTARCNNNCRHCYINIPAHDKKAKEKEISLDVIKEIADEAVSLGALWCLITGGEPLLRKDFFEIYLYLKRKGLLVSVFTNASLITEEHIELFKKYPPRDIEVTVYGVTAGTYEKVTRKRGSFNAFMRGLNLLLKNGVCVRLKATVLRSNFGELKQIAQFCRRRTKDYFRFDPFLNLRYDGDPERNREIKSERLSPDEIVAKETEDSERFRTLKNGCDELINFELSHLNCNHLFHCGAGNTSFTVSHDGFFKICPSLLQKDCVYDLKKGNLTEAWHNFVPKVRDMRSDRKEFIEKCRTCPIINLCMSCPAHSHLETGKLDEPVKYFCEIAHSREKMLLAAKSLK